MDAYRVRPDWVRRLNQLGEATGDPRFIVSLDPDEILAQARAGTGLDDVGDAAYLETYRRRMEAIDREASANLLGRLLCRAEAVRVLQTRLRLRAHWAAHPEVLEEPLERPIFIVGAPRTGTTILLELLALDARLRAPIAWEAHHPLPHDRIQTEQEALRVAESEQEFWADIQPELMTLHELRADLPCECVHFMSLDFGSSYWTMHYDTPSFLAWAATQPELVARTYAEHRRFLQTLQHGRTRRRWLLKSPAHLATIRELVAAYPDGLFIQTHRDPTRFVGSTASTTAMLGWLRSDRVDRVAQGRVAMAGFAGMLGATHAMRRSGQLPDHRFVDSHYLDLIDEPVATIRRIYEAAELAWPDGHEEAIESYLREKPKHKFGKHEYALDEFGLDESAIRAAFADYVKAHGVRAE